jgi:hypothetical protein
MAGITELRVSSVWRLRVARAKAADGKVSISGGGVGSFSPVDAAGFIGMDVRELIDVHTCDLRDVRALEWLRGCGAA